MRGVVTGTEVYERCCNGIGCMRDVVTEIGVYEMCCNGDWGV